MKPILLILLLTPSIHDLLAQKINFQDYFPLKDGAKKTYYVSFLKGTDTIRKNDTHSFCRSYIIQGKQVFYFEDEMDIGDTTTIGSNAFCGGAFYFDKGVFSFSTIFWKYELNTSKIEYFKPMFPTKIFIDTAYIWKNSIQKTKYVFTGFEDIMVKGRKFKNCLKLTVTQEWNPYHPVDTVWFYKKLGIVRWVRSSGRIEEIKVSGKCLHQKSSPQLRYNEDVHQQQ